MRISGKLEREIEKRIKRAKERAVLSDVPDADLPLEVTRRLGVGFRRSRYSDNSKYSDNSNTVITARYSDNSKRSPGQREAEVKNLPPVIGTDFFPSKRS